MSFDKKLALSLFFIRITVFLVLLMWTLDKFLNPGHIAAISQKFYFVAGITSSIAYVIAALEMVLIIGFLLGVLKRWTYGLVLLVHAASTLAPIKAYFSPYEGTHLLFFAAWPMLAACITLYLLRDNDTMLTLKFGGAGRP